MKIDSSWYGNYDRIDLIFPSSVLQQPWWALDISFLLAFSKYCSTTRAEKVTAHKNMAVFQRSLKTEGSSICSTWRLFAYAILTCQLGNKDLLNMICVMTSHSFSLHSHASSLRKLASNTCFQNRGRKAFFVVSSDNEAESKTGFTRYSWFRRRRNIELRAMY